MEREPIIDQCLGCGHIIIGPEYGPSKCSVYLIPSSKWRIGRCPMAPFLTKELIKNIPVNPIKASRRKIKGNVK